MINFDSTTSLQGCVSGCPILNLECAPFVCVCSGMDVVGVKVMRNSRYYRVKLNVAF